MKQPTTHTEQLEFLRKIEGQVRGIQRMIEEERYCVDILNQINSVVGALTRVENEILKKHIDGCISGALKGKFDKEAQQKIQEVTQLIQRFRRTS
ncbi:MAG TPA: metal-sensitive transcriptional regulator [Candidatus Omnitrophota bacterium]|nr:metal-sensitive transcriptional regulator [Candidatus Omnitrophota bacterium]HPD84285.1 metal-sensitive transcriptional regulator [Candidatus Omnitrophota bacterium]HRZ03142.1 metal-sensitive transcriptional regulator [Candidatus Omnitrophota bacterium]